MDQFITIKQQKISDLYGRENIYKTILEYVNKKDMICLYGKSGIGKTFLITQIIKNSRINEISHDILRNKNDTCDLLLKLKNTYSTILIDDLDTDYMGWKEIAEYIKKGNKISRGAFIIVSKHINKIDFCDCIELLPYKNEQIIEIGNKIIKNKSKEELLSKAIKCKGDIRVYLNSFEFDGERDLFFSPKDTIHNILCPSETKPSSYIGRTIEDHGYSWGIVHSNYLQAKNISLETTCEISDCMSLADMYDSKLYHGDWELSPFFCHEGVTVPAIKLEQSLCRETMKPGCAWTKYNNMKMRLGKIKHIQNKNLRSKMDISTLMCLRDYCIKEELNVIPRLKHYNFEYSDMDTLNHLALLNKIKPKLLLNIKKELKKE